MKPLKEFSSHDLDRLLAGRTAAGSGLDDVSRLVHAVQSRYLADVPPELETTHLAALMQAVNLTDKGDLAVRPASNVNGPARQASGLPKRRRRIVLESLFATVASKLALGGAAVAMAATGGLAATGNLPDRAQTAVSHAAETVGIAIPLGNTAQEAADQAGRVAEQVALEALERAAAQAGQSAAVPNVNADFGQAVAGDARDGGADKSISDVARDQAEERRAAGRAHRPEGAGPPDTDGLPAGAVPPADAGPPVDPGPPAGLGLQSQTGLGSAGDAPGGERIPDSVPGGAPTGVGGGRP